MKKWILFGVLVLLISGCGSSDDLSEAESSETISTEQKETDIVINDLEVPKSQKKISDFPVEGAIDDAFNEKISIPKALYELGNSVVNDSDLYSGPSKDKMMETAENSLKALEDAHNDFDSLPNDDSRYSVLIDLNKAAYGLLDFSIHYYAADETTENDANTLKKLTKDLDQKYEETKTEWQAAGTPISDGGVPPSTNTPPSDIHVTPTEEVSTSDITVLTENPSSEQISVLNELARTQFNKEFPYKGSKIHSVLGLIQDWTVSGDEWFYKAEATIVNESGAERKVNVEIHIAPLTADSGVVTITAY